MKRPLLLTSLDNPRIKNIVHLRKQRQRRASGLFVAEGTREVSRALQAGLKLRELFFCPSVLGVDFEALKASLPQLRNDASAGLVFEITPAILGKIAYIENPEGLLALFEPPQWSLEQLPAPGHRPWGSADLWLVAVGTEKPGNLGAMARSASAAGVSAVLVADGEVDPLNPNAIRASTGAVFSLPIVAAPSADIIAFLRARNVRLFAADPEGAQPYTSVDLTGPAALVIGAEDRGLDPIWRSAARESGSLITIPMRPGIVDSLNASNAAAILLFEAVRQRQQAPK